MLKSNMNSPPKILPNYIIYGSLVLGILCTIAFRSLTILAKLSPALVRPVWYFGVIGYIVFFAYRFKISVKRRKAVINFKLIEAVKESSCLSKEQKQVLLYLLSSIVKSKENINYLAIFFLSGIAVVADLILMYFSK